MKVNTERGAEEGQLATDVLNTVHTPFYFFPQSDDPHHVRHWRRPRARPLCLLQQVNAGGVEQVEEVEIGVVVAHFPHISGCSRF